MRKKIKSFSFKFIISLIAAFFLLTNFAFNYSYPSAINNADKAYPKNYFRSPLDIPLYLSGTFAEMRPNHLHSGIDIKTNSVEGLPVYSVADGYVSRVRIQAVGFGNSIYVTHPNGYVSVYAHLQRYSPAIAKFAKKLQYENQSFELDTLLAPSIIPVKKGDLIALSGNSGGSGGPHLHFEIRDEITEEPINPLLFGINVADNVAPNIQAIQVYPLDENSSVHLQKQKIRFPVNGSKNNYSINNNEIIDAWGTIGIGVECIDYQSNSSNQNGVYSIELKQNGERIYFSKMERFNFKDTKAINSHCDYKERNNTGRWVQKSFVDAGNPLTIYKDLTNRGRIALEPGDIYNMEYIVTDAVGNASSVKFTINCPEKNPYNFNFSSNKPSPELFPFDIKNILERPHVKFTFKPNTFYDTTFVNYENSKGPSAAFSSIHTIGNRNIALNDFFDIAIQPERTMTDFQKSKAIIFQTFRGAVGGFYENGFVKGRSKIIGGFYIVADSVAPSIKPVNISNGRKISGNKITCRISDNLSGIKSYNAYIDDQWVLMNYDQKSATLVYYFDERCPSGKHVFRLVVTDQKDNKSQYLATFYN